MRNQPVDIKQLEAYLKTELHNSGNFAGSEWREQIRESLDYFLLRNKGDEVSGRSRLQSGDVADVIDHVHADLQKMYQVDELCEVQEQGPNDTSAAAETKALNWYWRERCRGAEILDEAVQDGLLSRTGYLKVFFQESAGLPYEQTLEGDELQIRAALMQMAQQDMDIDVLSVSVLQEAVVIEPTPAAQMVAGGALVPFVAQETQYSVEIKVTPIHREVLLQSPAPEDMFISRDAVGSNMQQPRYVSQRRIEARQDVSSLGFYSVDVENMPRAYNTFTSDIKASRQSDANRQYDDSADTGGQQVELYEAYYRIDADRDGVPELLKVFHSRSGTILRWAEENPETGEEMAGEPAVEMVRVRPFASGSPMKVSHRHQGRSLHDKTKEIEDFGRVLIRQMADNLVEGNNVSTVYNDNVDQEDMEETEVGRQIRTRGTPATDVVFAKHNNIAGDSLAGLAYKDKMRNERSGTNIGIGAENMTVQQAAHSTERIMSAMEKVVGMYAQNFANNLIRDAFVLLHEQLKLMPGRISFQDGDSWAETEPRYWIERNRIAINLGKSDGEKLREGMALGKVIDNQRKDGNRSLSVQEYEARVDEARNAGLSDPEQYYLDPRSPEGQQKQAMEAQQAQEQRQILMMQQAQIVETQRQLGAMAEETKRMKMAADAAEGDKDRLADMVESMTKLSVENGIELPFSLSSQPTPPALQPPETVQ